MSLESRVPEGGPSVLALVALGSNLGDSALVVQHAMEALAKLAHSGFRRSSLWRSIPVDCPPGSPNFINAAAGFHPLLDETPESLLAKLQAIEIEFGRQLKQVLNEPRPLDLDLIAFGSEIRNMSGLILPHPRAGTRRFVLEPLNEIAPEVILPGQSQSISQLLARLDDSEAVTRLA